MTSVFNSLRQLGRDLRSQKLRTLLTTLGIVWGTVAVTLLLSFGQAMHKQMLKNVLGLGNLRSDASNDHDRPLRQSDRILPQ